MLPRYIIIHRFLHLPVTCVHVKPPQPTPSTAPPLPCETHPAQRPPVGNPTARDLTHYVPSRVSLLILHTQAESGAFSRDSSRFRWRRPSIYLNGHAALGQSRVYRVTQLRTGGVHCRESAGTGPVVLKAVPVTSGAATFLQVTMDRLMRAYLFPHPHLVQSGHVNRRYGHIYRFHPHQS